MTASRGRWLTTCRTEVILYRFSSSPDRGWRAVDDHARCYLYDDHGNEHMGRTGPLETKTSDSIDLPRWWLDLAACAESPLDDDAEWR